MKNNSVLEFSQFMDKTNRQGTVRSHGKCSREYWAKLNAEQRIHAHGFDRDKHRDDCPTRVFCNKQPGNGQTMA